MDAPQPPREADENVTQTLGGDDVDVSRKRESPAGKSGVEAIGGRIGPYRLVEVLGDGGMGLVYLAEQEEPFHRQVALKVIKSGLDTSRVVARFEAERQALAIMDHPHIARVYDAGTTGAGSPFFAMELCRGSSLTDYCNRHRLTPRRRIELFLTVCDAVQHAHQKGVIHRDLKPSNLLVTERDGGPEVKVIDFGIAKALDQAQASVNPGQTLYGQILGTPVYMSPEQAGGGESGTDTRSDLYSLGVILYELLTGATPLDPEELAKTAVGDLRTVMTSTTVQRPSNRLEATPEEVRQRCAAERDTAAEFLVAEVKGDLDWIAMTAIEPERERRYPTVAALAEDLRRYLADEPVSARPPSRAYLLAKFARRHRTGIAAAAAVAVALIAGTVVSTFQAVRATEAQADAEAATGEARRAEEEAIAAGERVRAALANGESLVGFMLDDLYDKLEDLERLALLEEVADRVLRYYAELPPASRKPEDELQKARAIQKIGFVLLSRRREDDARYAIETAQDLLSDLPGEIRQGPPARLVTAMLNHGLARIRLDQGDASGAGRLATEGVRAIADIGLAEGSIDGRQLLRTRAQLHSLLGEAKSREGALAAAVDEARVAVDAARELVDAAGLADGRRGRSRARSERDLAFLASLHEILGTYQLSLGDAAGAEESLGGAAQVKTEIRTPAERRSRLTVDVANALGSSARQYKFRGRWDDAERDFRDAIERSEILLQADPDNARWGLQQVGFYQGLGDVLVRKEDDAGAEAAFRAGLALVENPPGNGYNPERWRTNEAGLRRSLAATLSRQGERGGAEREIARSVELMEKIGETGELARQQVVSLARSYFLLASLRMKAGDVSGAAAALAGADRVIAELSERNPGNRADRYRLAMVRFDRHVFWARRRHGPEAAAALGELRVTLGTDPADGTGRITPEDFRILGEMAFVGGQRPDAIIHHTQESLLAVDDALAEGPGAAHDPAKIARAAAAFEALSNAYANPGQEAKRHACSAAAGALYRSAASRGHPAAIERVDNTGDASGPPPKAGDIVGALTAAKVHVPPGLEALLPE